MREIEVREQWNRDWDETAAQDTTDAKSEPGKTLCNRWADKILFPRIDRMFPTATLNRYLKGYGLGYRAEILGKGLGYRV